MRNLLKKILSVMPRFIRRFVVRIYSDYYVFKIRKFLKKKYPNYSLIKKTKKNTRPQILFYHISGLSFAGTEKFLQILAKHLDHNRYDVYFMYSPKPRPFFGDRVLNGRLDYFKDTPVKLISFKYEKLDDKYPYFVHRMSPSIFEVIKNNNIDLLITAGAGYSEFPFNVIKNIPIILLNIFGSPNVQKNIIYNICVSETVANRIRPIVSEEKIKVIYNQSEGPTKESSGNGRTLRKRLNIKDNEIVFGRIGRASDNIFDPIGIMAFKKVVKEMPWIHCLIMSPPPILREIVKEQNIPNVHFLDPSAKEENVWAFHQAIDVLAHFRKDGESCGLSIAEAMLCEKPIISHKSRYWNAHLEYLDDFFSQVAEIDNVEQYAEYMRFFAEPKNREKIKKMGSLARQKAEKLFLIENNISQFNRWIETSLSQF